MENKISFTGIKNLSYYTQKNSLNGFSRYLSAELSGQDFNRFRKAVKKSGFDFWVYEHPYQKNMINVSTTTIGNINTLFINNVPVEEIDEGLPLFQFAARLTRRTAKKKFQNFILTDDYKNSFLYKRATLLGEMIENPEENYYMRQDIKDCAKNINNTIQKIMNKYFDL